MTARWMVLAVGISVGFAAPSWADGNLPSPKQYLSILHPRRFFGPIASGEDIIVRGNVLYQVGIRTWPAIKPSSEIAPWYLWWPSDANDALLRHDFQSSPYPTWPATPQAADPRANGLMTNAPPQSPYSFQPVGYQRPPMPNYYGR
jgi:hypothetical protein